MYLFSLATCTPTSKHKTPILIAAKGKGKLHPSTKLRNRYGKTNHLNAITINKSKDLRKYYLSVSSAMFIDILLPYSYFSSTTSLFKKESIVRSEISNIGKLMCFCKTKKLKESCTVKNIVAFMKLLSRKIGLGPSGVIGKANSINHLIDYLKDRESNRDEYFK